MPTLFRARPELRLFAAVVSLLTISCGGSQMDLSTATDRVERQVRDVQAQLASEQYKSSDVEQSEPFDCRSESNELTGESSREVGFAVAFTGDPQPLSDAVTRLMEDAGATLDGNEGVDRSSVRWVLGGDYYELIFQLPSVGDLANFTGITECGSAA